MLRITIKVNFEKNGGYDISEIIFQELKGGVQADICVQKVLLLNY
jgi:hypothetical protein